VDERFDVRTRPVVTRLAVVVAFLAVVAAGLCGAAIGYGLVDIDCEGDCGTARGMGAVVGGVTGAAGVAIVAVLVLRALAEWRRQGNRTRPPAPGL
jgi:hypothetical protein